MLHIHEPFVPGLGLDGLRHAELPASSRPSTPTPSASSGTGSGKPMLQRLFTRSSTAPSPSRRRRATRRRATSPAQFRVIPQRASTSTRFRPPARAGAGPAARAVRGRRLAPQGPGRAAARPALRGRRRRRRSSSTSAAATSTRATLRPPRAAERFAGRVRFRGRIAHDAAAGALPATPTSSARRRSATRSFGIVLLEAMATGTAVARLATSHGYARSCDDGAEGLLVPPRNAARPGRRPRAPARRRRSCARPAPRAASSAVRALRAGSIVADEVDAALPRRDRRPAAAAARRAAAASERELFADFHVHTHHTKDCAMPVAEILERAAEVGLDVIAITDHNERRRRPRGARAGRPLRRARDRRRRGQDLRGRGHRPVPRANASPAA